MRYLVTGGSGFIGSNFLNQFVPINPQDQFLNVDLLTYAGNNQFVQVGDRANYQFIQADIADATVISAVFTDFQPDVVVNFAAESHVDQSITNPDKFVHSNVRGTVTLLDAARTVWDGQFEGKRFHQVSTDEVFGTLGETGTFTETSPYRPRSPYSASKAAADHFVQAYHATYGLPISITHCTNNYGPNQNDEKLIPTVIKRALNHDPIPIYGSGQNVRDWLYVGDHNQAIWRVIHRGQVGGVYNIGATCEKSNLNLVRSVLAELARQTNTNLTDLENLMTFVPDRPGHDFRYSLNWAKIRRELHWMPQVSYTEGMRKTVAAYLSQKSN
ncbi:dTDP-glucose 4,6-dehydratase [Levilactobacillus bambusae]|uniref:dTDP-glucose 4,6-dehydratase n=1 Tax=Levilactobacillus bambusae TaxID=2024736 RepID=A0A2V1N1C0_9LACO|nr:dTDP-glucose 4,6-dehydratase [Levilactobacillus bambusae]PWG00185.1 dTDP-glucose 4,6-dehydratase [Levilactobacillus bambusae]